MIAKMLCWLWRDVASVVAVGSLGMILVELAWLVVRLPGKPPRELLLLAGVAMCTWLHPRVQRLVPAAA